MSKMLDEFYLREALKLAEIRRGFCAPNPSVGAIIVSDNQIIATGYHFASGYAHAEIEALKRAGVFKNASLYVTLEPCCHWGKTPPCTEAILKSTVNRVVFGYRDPNKLVAGKGEAILNEKGIACELLSLPEINQFYESYHHWQNTKTPFVTAKIALSLDGKIAGRDSQPLAITGEELRRLTHLQRKKSDAILTTINTIKNDNPRLNVRLEDEVIGKKLYILDSELGLPLNSFVFETAESITVFHRKKIVREKQQLLINRGVNCVALEEEEGGLNLKQMLLYVGEDGVHDLWVEAGGVLFSALVKQSLVQRGYVYIAPHVVMNGLNAFHEGFDFRNFSVNWRQFGSDVLCEIRF